METWITDALSVHRLSQMVVSDVIFDRPRNHVKKALHEAGWTTALEGLSCTFCVSCYVGVAVVAARMVVPRVWSPLARALAFSDVAGIIASAV